MLKWGKYLRFVRQPQGCYSIFSVSKRRKFSQKRKIPRKNVYWRCTWKVVADEKTILLEYLVWAEKFFPFFGDGKWGEGVEIGGSGKRNIRSVKLACEFIVMMSLQLYFNFKGFFLAFSIDKMPFKIIYTDRQTDRAGPSLNKCKRFSTREVSFLIFYTRSKRL